MGALANIRNNLKESKIGLMLGEAFGSLLGMVNSIEEDDEQTVEQAIKETINESGKNPIVSEEMEKIMQIAEISEKVLQEKADNQLDTSNTFGKEFDVYGYHEIKNKLDGIQAKVSEEEALEKGKKARSKDGKQRTRVEED